MWNWHGLRLLGCWLFLRMRSSLKSNQIWGPRGHQSENFPSFRVLLYGTDCSSLKTRAWVWGTKESPCVLNEVNQTRLSVTGEVESILKAQPVMLAASQKPFLLHNSLHMDVYSGFAHHCQNVKVTKMSPRWWMDKPTVVHPYNETSFSHKGKWTMKSWKDMQKL